MNTLKLLSLLAWMLLAGGCATEGWQAETIPYPASTPFDANSFARRAYLDGFASGYRSAKSGDGGGVDVITGPNRHAKRLGYYAGEAAARSEPAKK